MGTFTTLAMIETTYSRPLTLHIHYPPRPASVDPHHAGVILLKPARRSGARLVLCPLLPSSTKEKPQLPSETWARVLVHAMDLSAERKRLAPKEFAKLEKCRRDLLLVSKSFKNVAAPILHSHIEIRSLRSLGMFHDILLKNDKKWDSLRRIPFSTPGRWVHELDLSKISHDLGTPTARFEADTLLSDLFRFLPFLSSLTLDPKLELSRRAMVAIADGCGRRLCVLKGLKAGPNSFSMPPSQWRATNDSIVGLVRSCNRLEDLEVYGPGMAEDEESFFNVLDEYEIQPQSLSLPFLHTLTLHGVPQSPLFLSLINSPLPALERLTLPIYPQFTSSPSTTALFLRAHAATIASLIVPPAPDWPPPDTSVFNPPPADLEQSLLHILPNLTRLNLTFPLPPLLLLPNAKGHLRTLLIPRPIPALLPFVQEMAGLGLKSVVLTKSRWLRSDLGQASRVARLSGEQSEMRQWKRLLAGKVRLIDADGRE